MKVLEDVFGEYMRTTVGKVFPSAGHGNVECGVHVGVRENALWYGSLADAAMVVEASFVKIYVISGRYMRIAHEIFIHQVSLRPCVAGNECHVLKHGRTIVALTLPPWLHRSTIFASGWDLDLETS